MQSPTKQCGAFNSDVIYSVNEISNDTTLNDSSATALVTENAAKTYVNNNAISQQTYLRKNFVKSTNSITAPSTASFNAVTASAPSDMTATSENDFVFGRQQVGELWWDTSTCRYVEYEQHTNRYRKENWGAMFPGSTVKVYEWIVSSVAPESYTGPGVPRDPEDYVTIDSYDEFTNQISTFYLTVPDVFYIHHIV